MGRLSSPHSPWRWSPDPCTWQHPQGLPWTHSVPSFSCWSSEPSTWNHDGILGLWTPCQAQRRLKGQILSVLGSISKINTYLSTCSSKSLRKPSLSTRCGIKSFEWFVLLNPLPTFTLDVGIFIIPILYMRNYGLKGLINLFKVKWTSWHLNCTYLTSSGS